MTIDGLRGADHAMRDETCMLAGQPSHREGSQDEGGEDQEDSEEARAQREAARAERLRQEEEEREIAARALEQENNKKRENALAERWREKEPEIVQFRALLSSRCNIFVHGPNGSGKTSFVRECVAAQTAIDHTHSVDVDCIEFYSERLLAICISQHLNTLLAKAAKRVRVKGKQLTQSQRKCFGFKICKTVDQLYENLRTLAPTVSRVKRLVAQAQIKSERRVNSGVDDREVAERESEISLGSLENIFFYLVLDNVKALFKIERQKKLIEKLAICQASI